MTHTNKHKHTHTQYGSSGRRIGPSQRLLPAQNKFIRHKNSMPPAKFEPAILGRKRQTHAFARADTGIGQQYCCVTGNMCRSNCVRVSWLCVNTRRRTSKTCDKILQFLSTAIISLSLNHCYK